ncbi:hypothetical protein SAMN06265348_113224 [Pedobacter westerhofensis]|uniref:Uncharacterized protein n=1 Tax=Pedobacter westerhofensis TaxID=425512 RepID=A0A521FLM5_9SPHI|nr:hypothetical protein [Pedobacter westerhofensis]SMO97049.1 hypothetical protein SAMN06265348_113224 [Pedobacter westerhofensis]
MKIRKAPTLIAIIVFVIITGFYSTYGASSDNWSKIGFPFPFYIYTEGKVGNLGPRDLIQTGFNPEYFMLDLVILGILVLLFDYLAVKFKVTRS